MTGTSRAELQALIRGAQAAFLEVTKGPAAAPKVPAVALAPPEVPTEAPEVPAAMPAPPVVTTLMVQNIPRWLTQRKLMKCIESSGFGGVCDFCHVPCDFHTKISQGHAFVNFVTLEAAAEFYHAWHRKRLELSHGSGATSTINVSAAKVQGLAANLERWGVPRRSRVRNAKFRPFVREF